MPYESEIFDRELKIPDAEFAQMMRGRELASDKLALIGKRALYAVMGAFALSTAVLVITAAIGGMKNDSVQPAPFAWLAVTAVILSIFLYDPAREAKKERSYETDRRLLLQAADGRVRMYKLRLGLIIALGALFAFIHLAAWGVLVSALTYVPPAL